jgi:hypothetical protein
LTYFNLTLSHYTDILQMLLSFQVSKIINKNKQIIIQDNIYIQTKDHQKHIYTSHLLQEQPMPPLYFSIFNLILSCIHCYNFFKNPNIWSFIDFIPKTIYVVYFLYNACMWNFEISVLYNCGQFPFYSFKQPNDSCNGWNMFLTDT